MLKHFYNLSLQRKQMLIIMLISTVALLMACAGFVTYDAFAYRRELVDKLGSLAEVVGNSTTAAIDFNDPASASQALAALRGEPNILQAHVHKMDGEEFAAYNREGASLLDPLPLHPGRYHEFTDQYLRLLHPILQGTECVGTIELVADLGEYRRRLWRYASIVTVMFGGSLVVAFFLSLRLGRLISQPIRELAQVVRSVGDEKNYSVRAKKLGTDELGELIDGFNEMLGQIQERDLALQSARETLELRVAARTQELAGSISLLNATLDSTADGILAVKFSGEVVCSNSQFAAMWNIPATALSKWSMKERHAFLAGQVKESEAYQSMLAAEWAAPETETFNVIHMRDGRIFERYVKPQRIDGQCVGKVVNCRDVTQRRQAELALQESQALYHSLVEQLPNGVFRKDRAGRYEFANSMFCRIMELPKEQILGKSSATLVDCMVARRGVERPVAPILGTQGETHHDLIMRTGQQIEVDDEYLGSDGKTHYYHTIKSAVFGSAGQIIGSQGVMFDITERKRVDVALRESQALYDSLVEHLPAGVFRKDREGRFVFVNSWYCRLKGVKAEYFFGKTATEVAAYGMTAHSEHIPEGMKDVEMAARGVDHHLQIMQTGKAIEIEEKYLDLEGRKKFLHVVKSPVFGPDGSIMGSQGMLFDITESKRAQAELAYERSLLRTLLDNAPDHIYFKDTQSRFIKTSSAQAAQFGLSAADDMVGKTDFDFFSEEHARPAYEDEQTIIRTGQPLIDKIEKETWRDGRPETWVLTTKMPFRNQEGEIIGTFGISKDITSIKESEAQLAKVHKELVETSRLAGMAEVATGVLHNVGNVLNSVNVASSCVAENLRKSKAANLFKVVALLKANEADLGSFFEHDPKGRQLLGYLAKLSEHIAAEQADAQKELAELQKHIDHIKDIVAMQQNFAMASGLTEIVNVTELVEDAISMNQSALARHDVKILKEFTLVPPVIVEKHKVLQILVNLMTNAKQACAAASRQDKLLTLQVLSRENRVEIKVADNGVGIAPENLTRIFSHGFTTKKDGHGFGLHSGALAAKEMGGALTVHSDGLGSGTVFTLELPIHTSRSTHA